MNGLVVLGATGSIGRQALDVASRLGLPVLGVAARRPSKELAEIAAAHPRAAVMVSDPDAGDAAGFREHLGPNRVHFGPGAVTASAATPNAVVVNGIVGAAGLPASVEALLAGNRLALANKESLVAGGPVVMRARERGGGDLVPVDSEHSALWQCLVGEEPASVRRLVLTASGGPFRGTTRERLASVTPDEALRHPTWSMGARITTDSATLMNKALEVIEAHLLFGVAYDDIDVVVHPQSVVHSMVEFVDGSIKAQLGVPDMRHPIQYAITQPDRVPTSYERIDWSTTTLEFEVPDRSVFRCLELGYEAGRRGGTAPAVLNAADEVAVEAFLDGRIRFLDIEAVVETVLEGHAPTEPETVEDVLAADAAAREAAADAARKRSS